MLAAALFTGAAAAESLTRERALATLADLPGFALTEKATELVNRVMRLNFTFQILSGMELNNATRGIDPLSSMITSYSAFFLNA